MHTARYTGHLLLLLSILYCGCSRDQAVDKPRAEGDPDLTGESSEQARSNPPLPPLIGVSELQTRLEEPYLRIIDARPVDAYLEGHIAGAVPVFIDEWKRQATEELEDRDLWQSQVTQLGIGASTDVVVYAEKPSDAARIWWTLKFLGKESVAILDGGWQAWQQAEGPTSTKETEIETVPFDDRFEVDLQLDRVAKLPDLKQTLKEKMVVIVDARTPEEYLGRSGGERAGHIPGAINIPHEELLTEAGRYKEPGELRDLFRSHGIDGEKPIVTHCQSGGRAAVEAFALELAGFEPVRNYYCGWREYSEDPQSPIASGPRHESSEP